MENEELVALIQTGHDAEENLVMLYQQNQGFIRMMAYKFSRWMEFDDLMQEAFIALRDAVNTYKDTGATFISWFGNCLKYHYFDVIDYSGASIPKYLKPDLLKYQRFRSEYKAQCGEYPSDKVVKETLEIDDKKLKLLQKAQMSLYPVSIYTPISEDEQLTLADTIPGEDQIDEVNESIDAALKREILKTELAKLEPREKAVIEQHYYMEIPEVNIGNAFNVSRERVRQIRNRALWKMKPELVKMEIFQEEADEYGGAYRGNLKKFNTTWVSTPERLAIRNTESK